MPSPAELQEAAAEAQSLAEWAATHGRPALAKACRRLARQILELLK